MSISYDYYKIFYYVATYHSINRAAAVLSNSQPNISRSISALESQLGTKLFSRSSTGVTLTEAGEVLYSHVEAAYRHLQIGEEAIRNEIELKGGVLTLGISSGLTRGVIHHLLAPTMHSFHHANPDVKMEVFHSSSASLSSDVSNNLVDIAFVTIDHIKYRGKGSWDGRIIHSYTDILVCGQDYSHLTDRKLSISDLKDYPIIGLWEESDTFDYYKNLFMVHGIEYKPSIKTISTGQILLYSTANFGLGFIHPSDAKEAIEEGNLYQVRLKDKLPERSVLMIKNTKNKKSALIFEQMLKDNLGL